MKNSRIHLGHVVGAAGFALVAQVAFGAPAADPGIQEMLLHHPQSDFLDGLLVLAVLLFAMSAVSFITWWNARHIPLFRTLAAYLFSIAVIDFVEFRGLSWEWIPAVVFCALNVELFAEALRIPKQPWIWLSRFVWLAILVFGFYERPGWDGAGQLILWALRLALYSDLVLIAIGVVRGTRRERYIAIPLMVTVLCYLLTMPEINRYLHIPFGYVAFGWLWHWGDTAQIILGAVIFNIFARELFADQREKQRLATEIEAARAVQQVLVPEAIPTVPGFHTAAVYKPFGEVGGDFFQILPAGNGGLLMIIGDVSGKGMPAAMTVALLVGTFRTLAHYTQNPGEILAAMNQRMLARSNGGFTTCLVVRADADGTLTAANAGHIAPLVNGEEQAVSIGLPLGLDAGTVYSETSFMLAPGARLTLMTDGVVEARKPSGELFGFDRAAAISTQPAEVIASTAQSFGQEDDITVVALSFA
jgi:Stage II sporulation protein E (SpoIIE)